MAGITRRLFLKLSGFTAGGLALGGVASSCGSNGDGTGTTSTTAYSGPPPSDLETFPLGEQLAPDEMRITFLGTSVVPRVAQECNSVFVETGNGDSFVFDHGSGVTANYSAMGTPPSPMSKVVNVSKSEIRQRRAVIDDWAWSPKPNLYSGLAAPLYPTPTAQLDQTILLDHCVPESVYDNPTRGA